MGKREEFNYFITINNSKPFTVREIVKYLKTTYNTAYTLIKTSREYGIIEKMKVKGLGGHYRLNPKYQQGIITDWCRNQMLAEKKEIKNENDT